jgi:predicted DNA-binding antitoxin AbrB/MazE fold protein
MLQKPAWPHRLTLATMNLGSPVVGGSEQWFRTEFMTIAAKYEEGVFKPLEAVTIQEGTVVEVRLPSFAERLKAKSRLLGILHFTAYGRTAPTSAIASNTSTGSGAICAVDA